MYQETEVRRVAIQPFDLMKQSLDLMGDQYWLFVGVTFVGLLISSFVPLGILLGPMMCGIYLCFFHRLVGKPASFELLFQGFDYFVESLIVTLLLLAASLVVMLPIIGIMFGFALVGATGGEGGVPILGMAFVVIMSLGVFVVSMIINACFAFAYPLVVDRRMKALDAVKASFRGVMANLSGVLVASIVFGVIYVLASCLCWFPAILFAPIPLGVFAILSRQIFPVGAKPEILG
jgi:hypothetical protein